MGQGMREDSFSPAVVDGSAVSEHIRLGVWPRDLPALLGRRGRGFGRTSQGPCPRWPDQSGCARARELEVTPHAKLEKYGVALLATCLSVLSADPCGGSEVALWEDPSVLRNAGIPVRVYGRAAFDGAPVRVLPLRASMPLVTSIEYGAKLLRQEHEALIIAYNEPALAGWAPDRVIVCFDWSTPRPRYWNWALWLSRFRRARYLFPSENEKQLSLECHHGRNSFVSDPASLVSASAIEVGAYRWGRDLGHG